MFNINKIKGNDKLIDSHKILFDKFLINFYNAWEYPEDHQPLKVTFKRESANRSFLRVDCSDGSWYHIIGPNTWY